MILDFKIIQRVLPHRYPFLMIDAVTEWSKTHAAAIKNVTYNEPYFRGHFPDAPIVPGILATESLLQTAAFIGYTSPESDNQSESSSLGEGPSPKMLCVAMSTKFKREITPGDQMAIKARLVKSLAGLTKVQGYINVRGEVVMEGSFSLRKL